jgi:hypothetical protein
MLNTEKNYIKIITKLKTFTPGDIYDLLNVLLYIICVIDLHFFPYEGH